MRPREVPSLIQAWRVSYSKPGGCHTRATRQAMQGLGFLHLQPVFQKLVRQHDRWKALHRAEISKAERLMEKENLKQNRRDDRRDIGKKNEIFKHGIKGIKKITGKYNTSKPLTEVKISCPCGLK